MRRTFAAVAVAIATVASSAEARPIELTFLIRPTSFYDYAGGYGPLSVPDVTWSIVVDDFNANWYQPRQGLNAHPFYGGRADSLPSLFTDGIGNIVLGGASATATTIDPPTPTSAIAVAVVQATQSFTIPGRSNPSTVTMLLNSYVNALPPMGMTFEEYWGGTLTGPTFNMQAKVDPSGGDSYAPVMGQPYRQYQGYAWLRSVTVLPPAGFAPAVISAPVPEPGAWATLALGLAGLAFWQRRRRS